MRDELVPKLDAYVNAVRGKECDYVSFDCVRYVAGWAKEATGADKLDGLQWTSLEDGASVLTGLGVITLPEAVSLRMRPIPVSRAMLGDLVALAPVDGGPWYPLGICTGLYSYFILNGSAPVRVRTMRASHAWSLE